MKDLSFLPRRRMVLAAACGSALPLLSRAHDGEHMHGMHNGAGDNPYASMTNAACTGEGLACANAATPVFAPDGTLWVAWTSGGAVGVSRSQDAGRTYAPATVVATHGSYLDAGPDARPQIVTDGQGRLTVAYAFFRDNNWNARIHVASSHDRGASFSKPAPIGRDSVSQRFPVLATAPNGHLFATWIDKRLVAADAKAGRTREGASIACAWSADGGRSFGADRIAYPDSCECCRIAVAMASDGLPALVFRAVYPGAVRDHASLRFRSEREPGPARRVADDGWRTHSCPHHGPAAAVSANGTLHAAWYTQGRKRQGVFYARSRDDRSPYSAPMRVGHPDRLPGRPFLLAQGSRIHLAWKEFDGRQASVWTRASADDGRTWSAPLRVAAAEGYTDHPLLVAGRGRVHLSWLTRSHGLQLIALAEPA
jgi:hypothetical protein